jgi:Flp pilus assembly protein CpaB
LLTTRGGTVAVGIGAAFLAAIAVLVYLNRYRETINSANQDVSVLVAKRLIPKGTPGTYIGTAELFAPTTFPQKRIAEGAISNPATIRGRVALHDIYPGEQMTLADFSTGLTDALATQLSPTQRAIAVPIDTAHGLIGQIQAGDRVDVYVGMNTGQGPVIKLLMENTLVMRMPGDKSSFTGRKSSNVILRANYQQAANLAFAVDNGKIWLTARPSANARTTPPELVTAETLLFGIPPVTASRKIRQILGGG